LDVAAHEGRELGRAVAHWRGALVRQLLAHIGIIAATIAALSLFVMSVGRSAGPKTSNHACDSKPCTISPIGPGRFGIPRQLNRLAEPDGGLSAGDGRQGSMKLARSAPAPSYALEFPGRWDRCIRRLWLRDHHSNAG
jgi:hypothetical protein